MRPARLAGGPRPGTVPGRVRSRWAGLTGPDDVLNQRGVLNDEPVVQRRVARPEHCGEAMTVDAISTQIRGESRGSRSMVETHISRLRANLRQAGAEGVSRISVVRTT